MTSPKNSTDDITIILFLCNWSPYTAYQKLQDDGYDIPPEIRMVQIPCTGRITKALLFKAFEMGADGVALVGCAPGACRYGAGTVTARENTADTRNILDLLGLGSDRMRFATFLPDQSTELREFLFSFRDKIKRMGKTPVTGKETELPVPGAAPLSGSLGITPDVNAILARYDAHECQDCGKCTAACPLAVAGKNYSPRKIVASVIGNGLADESVRADIQSCLTCGLCHERCPSDVDFPAVIRELRAEIQSEYPGESRPAHGGFFQSLMRAMTSPDLSASRWHLPEAGPEAESETDPEDEIRTDPESPILFFGGCAPYFDVFFRTPKKSGSVAILEDALRLLNFFDVTPRVLPQERCCGHDLLWSGDRENFLGLARLNAAAFKEAGITEIITACPECWRTLSDYSANGVEFPVKVTHIYEFLDKKLETAAVTFEDNGASLTYQDACRLNRSDLGHLPRRLLRRMAPKKYAEMAESGPAALCCGNSAWTGCDTWSKAHQVRRLDQARAAGADAMVTSCLKCRIHLRCAQESPFQNDPAELQMIDLVTLMANTIRWE